MRKLLKLTTGEQVLLAFCASLIGYALVLILSPLVPQSWVPSSGQEYAAWVQSIGSIVAILAAVFIAGWQHSADVRREEIRRQQEALDKAVVIREIALQAMHMLDEFRQERDGFLAAWYFEEMFRVSEWERMRDIMDAVPLHEQDPELIQPFDRFRWFFGRLVRDLDWHRKCSATLQEATEKTYPMQKSLEEYFRKIEGHIERLRWRHGQI